MSSKVLHAIVAFSTALLLGFLGGFFAVSVPRGLIAFSFLLIFATLLVLVGVHFLTREEQAEV